jgi:hypothetical protein
MMSTQPFRKSFSFPLIFPLSHSPCSSPLAGSYRPPHPIVGGVTPPRIRPNVPSLLASVGTDAFSLS